MEKEAYLEYDDVISQVSWMYFIVFLVKNHFLQDEQQHTTKLLFQQNNNYYRYT